MRRTMSLRSSISHRIRFIYFSKFIYFNLIYLPVAECTKCGMNFSRNPIQRKTLQRRYPEPEELSDEICCACCGAYHVNPYNPSMYSDMANNSREPSFCNCAYSYERQCNICGNMVVCDYPDDVSVSSADSNIQQKQTECIELPYQKTNAYQQLLKELQVTIKKRNEKKLREEERDFCSCNKCCIYRRNCNY